MKKGIVCLLITFSCYITHAQNVGIGTTTPKARLHVLDSSVLFSAADPTLAVPGNTPLNGAGARMMWYSGKAAFRTGFVAGTQWDKDSIGNFSFAVGVNTKAKGGAGFAAGHGTSASGLYSTALGEFTNASGFIATAMGAQTTASSDFSIAMGYLATASGTFSIAMGNSTTASGPFSTAMGRSTIASGDFSTALGSYTTASGTYSTAMGVETSAKASGSLAIGIRNDNTDNPVPYSAQPGDRMFQIGIGTSSVARQNAMTVLRNGNVGIGTITPNKLLEVIGPASLTPVTLVIGNRGGFGPAALEFVSDYGFPNNWRPGFIRTNDQGSFTGSLEFYTNISGNLFDSVKGFEIKNGFAYTATGTVLAWSDARLKNSITDFTDGLNVISKINPVQFYYNADAPFKTDQQQVGAIAQDLEKIAPYMIEKNKQNGYDDLRSVNNQAYTFLLINAVKEQQQQIEKQQNQIETSSEVVKQLQQQVTELKKLVEQLLKK